MFQFSYKYVCEDETGISAQPHAGAYSLMASHKSTLCQAVGCPLQSQMVGTHLSMLTCELVDLFRGFGTLFSTNSP